MLILRNIQYLFIDDIIGVFIYNSTEYLSFTSRMDGEYIFLLKRQISNI